jgi:phosphoglycerol transferase MdoB-like AlkP superfamily enzyme
VKNKRLFPPEFIRALIFFMATAMFFLGVSKIIFFIANRHTFQNIPASDLLASIWVDAITVALTFIPFIALWLLPFRFRWHKVYKNFFRFLFLLNITFLCASNLLDVVYYNYAGKRSTFDLFAVLSYEQNMGNHWITYIKDFWWLAVILILCLILANLLFNLIYKWFLPKKINLTPIKYSLSVVITLSLLFVVSRGGFGLRPFGLISIPKIASPENVGFVSNTAFTMIKSFSHSGLERLHLLDPEIAEQHFNPIQKFQSRPFPKIPENNNVLIIILESFGNEWLGASKENDSFTPFFDSLCSEGLYFPNSYSNGTKSIEAMPAVLASIPTLMETPYITSSYASNTLNGVGFMLKESGYTSAFFHSAAKGSMNFDGFAALIGFDYYFSKSDYPDQNDFDGTWGIYDHKFLPWAAIKMSEMKQPFFNAIFTISSHHPYSIPPEFLGKLKRGPHPICESLNYVDHALRLFFETAKKQPWYNNTLFVFVADHTAASSSPYYSQRAGKFSIPILYFMPNRQIPPSLNNGITQQIDILPSVLHLIGYDKQTYAFGQSVFNRAYKPYAITYTEGVFNLFFDNYLLTFSGFEKFKLYDLMSDSGLTNNIFDSKHPEIQSMCLFLQALIQRYNNDLLDNKTHAPRKK